MVIADRRTHLLYEPTGKHADYEIYKEALT